MVMIFRRLDKVNWILHNHPNYLASNGFDSSYHAGFFNCGVACLRSPRLTSQHCFRRYMERYTTEEWTSGVGGTKRRLEDMGDYQPCGLRLQILDKSFASRKEASFFFLPARQVQTPKENIKHAYIFHVHTMMSPVFQAASLFGRLSTKNITFWKSCNKHPSSFIFFDMFHKRDRTYAVNSNLNEVKGLLALKKASSLCLIQVGQQSKPS